MVGGVFHIPVGCGSPHKFPLIKSRPVRRFYLDGHIGRIHFVEDIAERGNVHRRFIERIHTVIDSDIPHIMLWEEHFQI